jgi:hypothetical protein
LAWGGAGTAVARRGGMNRLDSVIRSQRRLMYFNLAATVALMTGYSASILALF